MAIAARELTSHGLTCRLAKLVFSCSFKTLLPDLVSRVSLRSIPFCLALILDTVDLGRALSGSDSEIFSDDDEESFLLFLTPFIRTSTCIDDSNPVSSLSEDTEANDISTMFLVLFLHRFYTLVDAVGGALDIEKCSGSE